MPAFTGLLAPHWRPDARGVILGLSTYTRSAHIVRALLEAIAWQVHCATSHALLLLRTSGGQCGARGQASHSV